MHIAPQPDPVLRPYLAATREPETRRQIERLIALAAEVVDPILRTRWRVGGRDPARAKETETVEDVRGEVFAQLLARLREALERPDAATITSFRGLAATIAYRVSDSFLRKRNPLRASLKDKLRYLLTGQTNQQGFALWEGQDGRRLAGFAAWRDAGRRPTSGGRLEQFQRSPASLGEAVFPKESPTGINPGDLLAALFQWLGGPVAFDDLVNAVAALWGVRDGVASGGSGVEEEGEPEHERVADSRVDVAREVEQRLHLEWLWSEIRQLPSQQCAALLLNLRDAEGRGVIALLPLLRIATLGEVAAAMEMSFPKFAALWKELPIEDAVIAAELGITRQQVINLRKVARERLARRLRRAEAE